MRWTLASCRRVPSSSVTRSVRVTPVDTGRTATTRAEARNRSWSASVSAETSAPPTICAAAGPAVAARTPRARTTRAAREALRSEEPGGAADGRHGVAYLSGVRVPSG